MTIREYLESLKDLKHRSADGQLLSEALAESTQIWSNQACAGYVLEAMARAGVDKDLQKEVIRQLFWLFDDWTQDEAEEYWEGKG